jgi:hypothetical protein
VYGLALATSSDVKKNIRQKRGLENAFHCSMTAKIKWSWPDYFSSICPADQNIPGSFAVPSGDFASINNSPKGDSRTI